MLEATHYDSLLDDQESEPEPCPVCTGDDEAKPCSEDCAALMRMTAIERGIKGLYQRCRTALHLVRVYRDETWPDADARIAECMASVRTYRTSIACLRQTHRTVDMGYGQMVDEKRIRGRWVTQRTYWKQDEGKAAE